VADQQRFHAHQKSGSYFPVWKSINAKRIVKKDIRSNIRRQLKRDFSQNPVGADRDPPKLEIFAVNAVLSI
jgi:hypothetical protein